MLDLKACTVCFSTQGKLTKIDRGSLGRHFMFVSGLKESDRLGMPRFLCFECSAYVRKFVKFRDKCKRAHFTLKELLRRNKEIKSFHLKSLNREQIGNAPLSYIDASKVNFLDIKFKSTKMRPYTYKSIVPTFHIGTLPSDLEGLNSGSSVDIKIEADDQPHIHEIANEPTFNNSPFLGNDLQIEMENNYFDDDTNENDEAENDETYVDSDNHDGENQSDNTNLDQEYATLVPISENEAQAALEIYRMVHSDQKPRHEYVCKVCDKRFQYELRLKVHLRMHDQHLHGPYMCSLCKYYYKTEYLLNMHMSEKHLYKYLCKKCPEVSFDRATAKKHYIRDHHKPGSKRDRNGTETRPSFLYSRNIHSKKKKRNTSLTTKKPKGTLPSDYLICTVIPQEEQYRIVQERKNTRNYQEAVFRCELCFKGFREAATYEKHMQKHDPEISGKCQCDMCKQYFRSPRYMYKHMRSTHIFKFTCKECSFICFNKGQAEGHYKWHQNVTYPCPYCEKIFSKISSKLTHVRIKHPSLYICSICGHSFVSENGLYCHVRIAHTEEEKNLSDQLKLQPPDAYYCADCEVQFVSESAYNTHLGSSNKHATTNISVSEKIMSLRRAGKRRRAVAGAGAAGGRVARRAGRPRAHSNIVNTGLATAHNCDLCGEELKSDVAARAHYLEAHPGHEMAKRYMCDVCGHATRQYANLLVHMRTHTREKPYKCPHCDRTFSMPSNRDRHIVVHTGEKKYQCQHCNRRFTQSSAVKLHIQTVHLKIPYAPWDKKNRKRRKELEGTSAPVSSVVPTMCPPQPKLLLEPQPDYLSAYITYNE